MYNTRLVSVGRLTMGGRNPVWVQSMTNTDTRDVAATLAQIRALAGAGCDLVRISVYDEECARAVRQLVDASPVPLVADIHFDHHLAVMAAENGISKLRINPGNIGGEGNVKVLAACARMHHIPIRIGVNSGSIEKDILAKYGGPTAEGMVESALQHARMLEKAGFEDIVLSMKASDVRLTVDTYRLAAQKCDYPLHVGVTEAGLPGQGTIKSAIGIGSLLLDGIGNTIRVSLTGDPLPEAKAAWDILHALGMRTQGVQLVSCPTCGRTCIDVAGIAARVEKELSDIKVPLKVALCKAVFGEGDNFFNRSFFTHQHYQAIQSRSNSSVRWSTILEGLGQEAEFLLAFCLVKAYNLEDSLLQLRIVDTDGTRGQFVAVENQVVQVTLNASWVTFQCGMVFFLGHSEHVVSGVPFVFFLVPLKHGEVHNPCKGKLVRIAQVQVLAQATANSTQGSTSHGLLLVGNKEQQVSSLCSQLFAYYGNLTFKEFSDSTFKNRCISCSSHLCPA